MGNAVVVGHNYSPQQPSITPPPLYIVHVHYFILPSEEHQSQLVQCGGLPLIITLLTDDSSEEIRRAATFILQTCKQASKPNYSCLYHNC